MGENEMKILVIGGAGAMGMVTVRDLAESSEVSEVVIADANVERAKQIQSWTGSKKVSVTKLDVSDHESLVNTMQKADAVADAAPYHLNMVVTKAAIEAKRNLTDLGGVYHMTLKQLELDTETKKAGVSIVLGCGIAPGIADILTKFGADKLDTVDEAHIRYGEVNFGPAKYKWTFRTVLEEYTAGPVVFEDGKFKELAPFSGKHVFEFPEPIGKRNCCYALYSGLPTLPKTIGKGVRVVDCAMVYTNEDEQRIKILNEMAMTSTQPIKVDGVSVSPREFLFRVAPPPDVNVRDAAGIVVTISGKKNAESVEYTYSLVFHYHEKYGVSALAYLTGMPLSVVTQMLAKSEIKQEGVMPPETAVKPEPFFKELAKRGVKITETVQRTRVL
jgi:saccharopine dehydrogenase-like NADP-dependent oxidoreductase